MSPKRTRPLRLGVALGGGAARGWAHIGVLLWLREQGIHPQVVAGTSIGALVGGAEVAGQLERLDAWVRTLEWSDVVALLDFRFSGGLIRGQKLFGFFRKEFTDVNIEQLQRPYGAVAADIDTGTEVWLREGSLLEAVRASVALPGLFSPHRLDGRWLVDGGLVNPVPVSLCRALGAERIIAVDLNSDLLQQRLREQVQRRLAGARSEREPEEDAWWHLVSRALKAQTSRFKANLFGSDDMPSLVEVIVQSVYIMQSRITRARMAGDPPDVLVTPRVGHIRTMEFHRAAEAIEAGYLAAEQSARQIEGLLTGA